MNTQLPKLWKGYTKTGKGLRRGSAISKLEDRFWFCAGNGKIPRWCSIFSLLPGISCPGALICRARVIPHPHKANKHSVYDYPEALAHPNHYRCYAASLAAVFKPSRVIMEHNFALAIRLQKQGGFALADRLIGSIPPMNQVVRIHVSGDFYSAPYFLAWCSTAAALPDRIFYAYTKSLDIWVANQDRIPPNLKLIASKGGKHDHLIDQHNLRFAEVVFSVEEAKAKGLKLGVDYNDNLAWKETVNFALLIHGTQPKGSKAAEALKILEGIEHPNPILAENMDLATFHHLGEQAGIDCLLLYPPPSRTFITAHAMVQAWKHGEVLHGDENSKLKVYKYSDFSAGQMVALQWRKDKYALFVIE